MAVTAKDAVAGLPYKTDVSIITASATGVINPGDWLMYSGQYVWPSYTALHASSGYFKSSGIGVALESNPVYDQYGNSVQNSALKVLVQGIIRVSASFSGKPALGLAAYPDASGSAVGYPTGMTGVGATWNTAEPLTNSAMSGTANAQHPGVATVIGIANHANAGTGELILLLTPPRPDIRG
jgi:hypothetical protein